MTTLCKRCKSTKEPDFFVQDGTCFKQCNPCRKSRYEYIHQRGGLEKKQVRDKTFEESLWYMPARMVHHSKEADRKAHRMPDDMSTYVTQEYIQLLWSMQEGKCIYCSCEMETMNRKASNGCTIQRLDDTVAHTEDNVVLCCHSCNMRN